MYFIFMCVGFLPSCMFLVWCPQRPDEGIGCPGTEVTVVSHQAGTRNWTQVLLNSSQCT